MENEQNTTQQAERMKKIPMKLLITKKTEIIDGLNQDPIVETNEYIYVNRDEIFVTAYDLIENDYEDGVYVSWDYPDDMSEDDKEVFENAYDEDGDDGLAALGWDYSDSEDKIVAPYKVSKV